MKRSRCVRCRLCGDWKHNVIIVNTFLCIVGASVSGVGVGLQSELSQDWQLLLNRFPLGPFGRAPILVQPSVFEMCANAVTCTGGFIVVSSLYAIFVAAFEWETMLTAYLGACAVLVLIQIAVVVCCAYYAVQVDLTVGTSLLEYITISYRGGVALDSSCDVVYSNDTDSVVFDKAMTSLKCCGAKHANDFAAHSERWERNVTCYGQPFNMEVPVACCRKETPNARNTPEEMVFVHLERCLRAGSPTYSQTQPCIPEIKKMFHKKTMIVVTLNGTTIIGLVFSFLFTMCHRNNLRERGSESMSTILSAIYDAERRSCHSRGKTSNPQSLSPSVNSFTMHTFKSSHDPVRRKRPIHHSPATSRVKSPDRMQSSPVEIHIAPAESRERGYSPTTSKHREVVDGPTNVSTNFTH